MKRKDVPVRERLLDAERPGSPTKFSTEQVLKLLAIACDPPETYGRPISHWTSRGKRQRDDWRIFDSRAQETIFMSLNLWFVPIALIENLPAVTLGKKGQSGCLQSMKTRAEFLSNSEHKVVFHYTPKHCSWLNQIEIWFSILMRKLLKRSSFDSEADLACKILDFIAYYNDTMAKPFKWTYKGKALTA